LPFSTRFCRGNTLLQNANAFVAIGDQDLVDHKAGGLIDHHGGLADLQGQGLDLLHQLSGGIAAGDDFHQLHGGHGVEEVHTHQVMLQTVGHLGDGQRRGVGGKDGLFLADRIQLAQQLLLGGHVLSDALDDQIGVCSCFELLHHYAAHQIIGSFLSHLALGHSLVQRGSQLVTVTLSACHTGSIHHSHMALGSKDLCDTAAHGASAKHCNFHTRSSYSR